MCINYRGLNAITVKNAETLPRIDNLLDRVQSCRHFSMIDLKSGYHQIEVLEKLKEANFKINAKKCEWAKTEVLYLGHVLDEDGIKPEDSKIAAIRAWPTPRTLTELRSFLGLANYYRKFARNFSIIVIPLRRLLKKEAIWQWDKDCTFALKKLKRALIEYLVLKVADPSLSFVVTTDASRYGIGAVLQQDDDNGYKPVEFMSTRMPSEKDCYYCGIRKHKEGVHRYTIPKEDVVSVAMWAFDHKYGTLMLQAGQLNSPQRMEYLVDLIREIRRKTIAKDLEQRRARGVNTDRLKATELGLCVALSVGELSEETYKRLYDAGASRYLLRIETSNPELFSDLHPGDQMFEKRLKCLRTAKRAGFQIGTGVMIGLPGQTLRDLANDIVFFRQEEADMVSAKGWVRCKGWLEPRKHNGGHSVPHFRPLDTGLQTIFWDVLERGARVQHGNRSRRAHSFPAMPHVLDNMAETRKGTITAPYTAKEQEKMAALVKENRERKEREKQAKLKAIAEEQATKMKEIGEEMEKKKKAAEKEVAAEEEKERMRTESREGSSGTKEDKDAEMEKKISEWVANLSLGEDEEAQMYVPEEEKEAFARALAVIGDPLERQEAEEEKRLEWKLRMKREKKRREEANWLTAEVEKVLEKFREANFKINSKKCEWAKTQVLYLGHVLDGDGIKPEDSKIAAIRDWPTPRTLTELPSFVGLANYYRKFVRNLPTIAAPLRRLLKKEAIWQWDKDCTSAVKKLKRALIEYPVLKVADPSLPFVVTTDASQYGIGAVLQQDDDNGYRPVEFMSARMPCEKTHSGKDTSPYSEEQQEKMVALVRENKERKELEKQAKLKAIAEEHAAKMKRLEEEMKRIQQEEEEVAEAEFVIVYLDDILILSKTVEEHVVHLDKLLSLLRQHKCKINGEKREFGRTRVVYLGYEIFAEGLKPDDAKVANIRDWPRPQSVIEMRSFLGMTSYCRNFMKNYSIVATPLIDLTRLDTPWEWTETCEAAFRHLKHALRHYEVLKLPDPDKPFIVTTDASQYGIGAVLAQQEGKKLRPIEYMSKKMPSQKLAKSTYEKELFAVYKALTHWRHYLLGRFFILRTDHQTLRWMRTRAVLSDTLKHWIEVVEQYDFEPEYIKGEYNKVVDALSRRPDFSGALITEFNLADNVTQPLVEAYREDPFMAEIIRRLEAKDKGTSPEFELVCQSDKPRTQAPLGLLKPLPITERPGESLSMDFMDTLVTNKSGMRYIYVIVDRFSKFARLVAMSATTNTEYVIKMFKENRVRDFGLPKFIVSDRDVQFTSELWKAAAAEQGMQLQMTSGNHPEANGQAEQMNRAVQHLLRHYIKPNQVDWDKKLTLIASLYNNVVHSATGVSPNSLLPTFTPVLPLDFLLPDNQPTAAPGT
ncbi:hypothetical protein CBR_g28634 [Chara braunii]|uniref:Uncharacterized protein n=1 Tax=Chara braunii TaxID=69332 RepID=A0A388L9D4_CHABU|nr:hypothetical protein CBR_g28634 [Chara braunii]|eukprot:GBG78920.1 hypothetical protein CBR_g28634 [Chara braunii]